MKLYYLPGACPLASHIVLEWIGKPYQIEEVARTELKGPEFLALNPLGQVPVLVDGDFVLTQSASVLEYLAETNPEAGLLGDTAQERAEMRRWLGFCNSDLHRSFHLIFAPAVYVTSPEAQAELIAGASHRLTTLFRVADSQLANKKWLTGSRSIADPYLYTLLRWAKAKNVDISDCTHLHDFFRHMQADRGVEAALVAQGLGLS